MERKIIMRAKKKFLHAAIVFAGLLAFTACDAQTEDGKRESVQESTQESTQAEVSTLEPLHEPYYSSEPTAALPNLCYSYVEFGKFPQTRLAEEEISEAIKNAGYDENGYCEVEGKGIKKLELEGETNYYLVEPIRWKVVAVEEDVAVLASDLVIDVQPYHNERKNVLWKDCSLRGYLNEEFIQIAFDETEQSQIVSSTNKNYKLGYASIPLQVRDEFASEYMLEDTEDKIYIPLEADIILFGSECPYKVKGTEERHNLVVYSEVLEEASLATDYATDLDAALFKIEFPEDAPGICWWTRTSLGDTENIVYANEYGTVNNDDFALVYYACSDAMGVRPVLRVKKDGLKVVE
jgi:hypothetical protein